MKNIIGALIVLFSLILSTEMTEAQSFQLKDSIEDIEFYYKWRKVNPFKKDSEYRLVLRMKNNIPTRMEVSFNVNYYWQLVLHSSSEEKTYCIRENRWLRGRLRGLAFPQHTFTKEEIEGDMFDWEIVDFKMTGSDDCKPELYLFKDKSD